MCAPRLDGDSPPSVVPHEAPLEPEHSAHQPSKKIFPERFFFLQFFFSCAVEKCPRDKNGATLMSLHLRRYIRRPLLCSSVVVFSLRHKSPPPRAMKTRRNATPHIQTHTHKHSHTHTHTRTKYTRRQMHTHSRIYTHVYTHTHTPLSTWIRPVGLGEATGKG